MRVALVCPYDLGVPGGVQAQVLGLAANLRARGDEVATFGPGGDDVDGHLTVGKPAAVRFNRSVAPIGLSPLAVPRIVAALRAADPDVVHIHEPAVPWASLAATARSPAPTVGTFHAWSDRDRLYRAAGPLLRPALRRLAVRIAVSPAAAAYHAAALHLPVGHFTVIPNGLDVELFAAAEPQPRIAADPRPHLLFLGRLERRKGVEYLLRAFTIVKSTRPEVRLLIAGDGPERDRCEALLPARLRADVEFLGYVTEDDKRGLLRACDVFVAPNLGGESFGIVLAEALAAGRPVVASDLPGFRAVVDDGVTGRLAPPGEPRALAAAIGALLDNGSLRRAMGTAGRQAVRAFDWSVVTERIRDAYGIALQRSGSQAG